MSQVEYQYRTVGFHFEITFYGLLDSGSNGIDASFQSVSGLDASFETETIKEGGENRFEHVIPARRKYGDLILKRGTVSPDSASRLSEWCMEALDYYTFQPIDIDVVLLNEEHEALMRWGIIHAWPKAWKFGELNAEKSEVLIETIELNYNYFEFYGY